jgi:gliding motility-associated-like protein
MLKAIYPYRFRLFVLLFLMSSQWEPLAAQPAVWWDRTLGGENYEELNGLLVVADGIVAAGSSKSNIAFGRPTDYSWNIWICKLDFDGNVIWQRYYGGDQDDRMWNMIATSDGGFLVGGFSYSGISGDKTEASRGDKDVWLIKLDAQGQLEWDKTLGSQYQEELFAMQEMPDESGFLLGCHSNSDAGGDKSDNGLGNQDFWILRIDNQGFKVWDETLGGDNYDQIHDLEWTPDGMILVSGGTASAPNSGDIGPDEARGGLDFFLLKYNPYTRQVLWSHRYGGEGGEFAYGISVQANGHIWLGGGSNSPPNTASNGKKAQFLGGNSDYWLIELDANGALLRDWSFGGTGLDDLYWIQHNTLGQVVLGGVTDSDISGSKTTAGHGGYDFWLIGLDRNGQKTWEKTVGGTDHDALTKIALLPSGALVFGGHSQSNIGFEKSQNTLGVNDFWVLSTSCEFVVEIQQSAPLPCVDEPSLLDASISDCNICHYEWSSGDTVALLQLPPGTNATFRVLAFDDYGCFDRDTASVSTDVLPTVDIGPPDTLVRDDAFLQIGTPRRIGYAYLWNTGDITSTLVVEEDGTYTLTVTDEHGCTASDEIYVEFVKKGAVYVPNVFMPDDDGLNEWMTVYADHSVREVKTFRVADRWGGLCFRRDNFQPNDDQMGWNGTWRGKEVPAGVYAWLVIVELKDGTTRLLEGDVTILR